MGARELTTAFRNRQHYIRILKEKAREIAGVQSSGSVHFEQSKLLKTFRLHPFESSLHVPENWKQTSKQRLLESLKGIVPAEKITNCDLFLCALIHPSYVRSRSVRAAVAMPTELTYTGSSTLRLLREVAAVHGLDDYLQRDEIASVTHKLQVSDLILFDKAYFVECGAHYETGVAIPEEVRLAAATALCGAVTLSEDVHAAALLLDQLRDLRNVQTVSGAVGEDQTSST
ncbi:hypothetical protein ERJ75_000710300 [Trypanosoma vivax]|uniref:Uncharacterized protein n=1 Tax=Trypanosoma vivax (strain Y486) TaxID=1055687 RepID=G0TTX2_TRYVY|nr:hypothetical protein TRVL_02097 [Trypanosoma vivax]KAH8613892.1 hypothetical protein ERJ75_000710300 [Trypanosoma vivax]CCC47405.1 conserved hypothetical protein [Trypanosoma vivax Y486]